MSPTILLADGDPLAGKRLRSSLAGEPYRVVQAATYDDALRLADELVPEIILYDLNLSGLSPEDACRRLRALPLLHRCVIILTGSRERCGIRIDPFSAPIDDFIAKPYPPSGLSARLRGNLLRRREMDPGAPAEKRPAFPYEISRGLQSVLGEISRFKRLQRCSVALLRPDEHSAYVLASSDAPRVSGLRLDLRHYPELMEVKRTAQPLVIANIAHSQIMADVRSRLAGQPFTAMLVVPLLAGTQVIGAMVFRSATEGAFADEEILFCRLMAMMFAQALQDCQNRDDEAYVNGLPEEHPEKGLVALCRDNLRLPQEPGAQLSFLQAAAQKLRAPVTAIHGFCSLALEGDDTGNLSGEQREYLDKAMDCSERLVGMMSDVIDLVRLQSGDIKLDLQPRALDLVVRSACDDLVRREDVCLHVEPAGCVPPVQFDVEHIRRVMSNLLSNAVQLSARGGRVNVRLQKNGNEMQVHVDDDGHGEAAVRLEKLIEEFDPENDPCGLDCASGLGLTLCRAIIQAHGGRIWASRQGRGSRLSFSLPL